MYDYRLYFLNQEVPSEILNRIPYPQKAKNYFISRMALLDCLQSKSLNWDDLEIESNLSLKNDSNTLVSISHTEDIGAAITASAEHYLSIGIDIEKVDRPFNKKTQKFFVNSSDLLEVEDSILELWSHKESAFKALSPVISEFKHLFDKERELLLKDIWVKKSKFGLFGSELPLGFLKKTVEIIDGSEVLVTMAFLTPELSQQF